MRKLWWLGVLVCAAATLGCEGEADDGTDPDVVASAPVITGPDRIDRERGETFAVTFEILGNVGNQAQFTPDIQNQPGIRFVSSEPALDMDGQLYLSGSGHTFVATYECADIGEGTIRVDLVGSFGDPVTATVAYACHEPGTELCGNEMVNEGEDCDGGVPPGFTCESVGQGLGDLICNSAECAFDTSLCTGPVSQNTWLPEPHQAEGACTVTEIIAGDDPARIEAAVAEVRIALDPTDEGGRLLASSPFVEEAPTFECLPNGMGGAECSDRQKNGRNDNTGEYVKDSDTIINPEWIDDRMSFEWLRQNFDESTWNVRVECLSPAAAEFFANAPAPSPIDCPTTASGAWSGDDYTVSGMTDPTAGEVEIWTNGARQVVPVDATSGAFSHTFPGVVPDEASGKAFYVIVKSTAHSVAGGQTAKP